MLPLVGDVEIDCGLVAYFKVPCPRNSASWPLISRSGSRKLPRFHPCLKKEGQDSPRKRALDKQCQHHSGKALRRYSPLSQTSPYGSLHLHLAGDAHPSEFLVNKHLPALKAGNPEDRTWNFDCPAAAKMFDTASVSLKLSGTTMYQTRHSGTSADRRHDFSTLQKNENEDDNAALSRYRSETS